MRRLITGIATGALALGLIAGPALATQCPLLIKQINDAAGNRLDAASAQAKALAAEADALHKAGKHADSVKKAEEAAKAIGLKLQMK
ncbi:MAG: hypothetical protein XU13_C0010G0033 [Candidatus Rokubacteria bacterium CSP1-6]|nr:MAG: hypothetical protein XU13_C0010G0033 [Candidatus Rokubacteria bacterium CSP1-6]